MSIFPSQHSCENRNPEQLITENLDIWTAAIQNKASTGRGSNKKQELYGIKKLRELILELAVRGLLVPQDPNDEPASVLLEKISVERAELVKEKKIKKPKKLPSISDEEKVFPLPRGWSFVRLNDLGEWGAGATPKRGNSELYGGAIPWFKSGELSSDYICESEETVTELALKQASLRYNKPGDVLIAMYGATIGKTSILNVAATTNQAVCACTPFTGFSNVYLLTLLKAFRPRFIAMGAGGAQPNISRDKIIATVIALPPEAEQPRIVAKVDELMALCDQLEQQTESSLNAHQTLVKTLLKALLDAAQSRDDASAFEQAWQRIADHFDVLFTTEHSIDQLKQTILQLAVMGKLVPQDPNDEPASVLLEKIAAEKERLVSEGQIKKQKKLPPISEDEKPFELPDGWLLVRLGELADEIATGPFGSMVHKRDYIEGGVPLINPSHMIGGRVVEDQSITVSEKKAMKLKSHKLREGDLVMARRGEMGRSALVTSREENWLCGTGSFVLRFHELVDREYLLLLFKTKLVKEYLGGNSVGMTMTNLNHTILNKLPLLIPPEKETSRIFLKIEELMAICDLLKSDIRESLITQIYLADALAEAELKN